MPDLQHMPCASIQTFSPFHSFVTRSDIVATAAHAQSHCAAHTMTRQEQWRREVGGGPAGVRRSGQLARRVGACRRSACGNKRRGCGALHAAFAEPDIMRPTGQFDPPGTDAAVRLVHRRKPPAWMQLRLGVAVQRARSEFGAPSLARTPCNMPCRIAGSMDCCDDLGRGAQCLNPRRVSCACVCGTETNGTVTSKSVKHSMCQRCLWQHSYVQRHGLTLATGHSTDDNTATLRNVRLAPATAASTEASQRRWCFS